VSRAARFVVVLGIACVSWSMLGAWHENLLAFEREEVAGLNAVMRAAPARLRLHYVKLDPDSKYFEWHPFWHLDKMYMSDKFGQVADTPGVLSTSPIRYREGVDVHRIGGHSEVWYREPAIWKNFDLILLRRWHPTPAMLTEATTHGNRIAQSGDWELWLSHEAVPVDLHVPEDKPAPTAPLPP
jgi:hypothetical protein